MQTRLGQPAAHSPRRQFEMPFQKSPESLVKDGRMVWGEAVGLFGLACFWALTLFVVFREPAA
jgi:hypothetical protein